MYSSSVSVRVVSSQLRLEITAFHGYLLHYAFHVALSFFFKLIAILLFFNTTEYWLEHERFQQVSFFFHEIISRDSILQRKSSYMYIYIYIFILKQCSSKTRKYIVTNPNRISTISMLSENSVSHTIIIEYMLPLKVDASLSKSF